MRVKHLVLLVCTHLLMSFQGDSNLDLTGTWNWSSKNKKLNESRNQITFNDDGSFSQIIWLKDGFDQDTLHFDGTFIVEDRILSFNYGDINSSEYSRYKICKLESNRMVLKFNSKNGYPRRFTFKKTL